MFYWGKQRLMHVCRFFVGTGKNRWGEVVDKQMENSW
jgi:hypothetical protein